MKDLQIINEQEVLGKDFKMYGTFEEPLFLASDVATWLEERDGYTVSRKVSSSEKATHNVCTPGGVQKALFLTEFGLYEVFMQSRKDIAVPFKDNVKLILKTIRLTGKYEINNNNLRITQLETKLLTLDRRTSKDVRGLSNALKSRLSMVIGRKITATNLLYISEKNLLFAKLNVSMWEEITTDRIDEAIKFIRDIFSISTKQNSLF